MGPEGGLPAGHTRKNGGCHTPCSSASLLPLLWGWQIGNERFWPWNEFGGLCVSVGHGEEGQIVAKGIG